MGGSPRDGFDRPLLIAPSAAFSHCVTHEFCVLTRSSPCCFGLVAALTFTLFRPLPISAESDDPEQLRTWVALVLGLPDHTLRSVTLNGASEALGFFETPELFNTSREYLMLSTGDLSDYRDLADAGITKGCNPPANDRFCPDDRVTRGQMAAFLNRAFNGR